MVELPVAQYNKAMAEQLMSNQLETDLARNAAASKNEQMRQLTQSAQIYKDNMRAMTPYELTDQYTSNKNAIAEGQKINPNTGLSKLSPASTNALYRADQNAREAHWAKTHGAVPYESGFRDLNEREKYMENDVAGRTAYAVFGGSPYQSVLRNAAGVLNPDVSIEKGMTADAARDQLKHKLAWLEPRDETDPTNYSENFRAINELYIKQKRQQDPNYPSAPSYDPTLRWQPNPVSFYGQGKKETTDFYAENYETTKPQYKRALILEHPEYTAEQINTQIEIGHPPISIVKGLIKQGKGYIDQYGFYTPYGENYGKINWDNTKPGGDWSKEGLYKKRTPHNYNKTLKQTQEAIYHPIKQQKTTKKQKSVFEEMFGKQRADPRVNVKKPITKKAKVIKKSGKKPVSVVEQLFGKRVKFYGV